MDLTDNWTCRNPAMKWSASEGTGKAWAAGGANNQTPAACCFGRGGGLVFRSAVRAADAMASHCRSMSATAAADRLGTLPAANVLTAGCTRTRAVRVANACKRTCLICKPLSAEMGPGKDTEQGSAFVKGVNVSVCHTATGSAAVEAPHRRMKSRAIVISCGPACIVSQ